MREAPVAKVERKPAGLWLELTPSLWDFSEDQLGRLDAYLAPITPIIEKLRSSDPQWPWPRPPVEAPSAADEYADYRGNDTLSINVHLRRTPSKTAAAALDRAVRAWYRSGVEGAYGGHFHDLDGPTRQGQVVGWTVDMRSVDVQMAVDDIGRRLAGWAAAWRTSIVTVRFGVDQA